LHILFKLANHLGSKFHVLYFQIIAGLIVRHFL
jgi:hypothetical protein